MGEARIAEDYDVFISYADEDRGAAVWVALNLQALGFKVFYYLEGVKPKPADWPDTLAITLGRSRAGVLLVSNDACASDLVKREVSVLKSNETPIVPVYVGTYDETILRNSGLIFEVAAREPSRLNGLWQHDKAIVDELSAAGIAPVTAGSPLKKSNDAEWLKWVLDRAESATPKDELGVPRPKVAAALVWKDHLLWDTIRTSAGAHAERSLVGYANSRLIPHGTTLYTTLEPCSQAPDSCSDAIVRAKRITRVVMASLDWNPEMRGRGLATLQDHGLEVALARPTIYSAAKARNESYVKFFSSVRNRSKILVAVPAFHDMPFFSELMQALLEQFDATSGLDAVPAILGRDHTEEQQTKFLNTLEERQHEYQGFVLFPARPQTSAQATLRRLPRAVRKPLIFLDIDPFADGAEYPERTYFVGSSSGSEIAAEFLAKELPNGAPSHQVEILVVGSAIKSERQEQLKERLDAKHFSLTVINTARQLSRKEGRDLASPLLARAAQNGRPYRAVYATTDELAIGVYEATWSLGPGQQPKVILGFDGLQEMRKRIRFEPSRLATLSQDMRSIARTVTEAIEYELSRGRRGQKPKSARTEYPPILIDGSWQTPE
jgi:pyrimidine deaminase RibD-like protein/DNA-binding LacI/PurR family transcriptional regulator